MIEWKKRMRRILESPEKNWEPIVLSALMADDTRSAEVRTYAPSVTKRKRRKSKNGAWDSQLLA
jgi:hypothetical protein